MSLPSVLLHDHLDGGLRPDTVLELAEEVGHHLPARAEAALAAYFDQRRSGSLESYLASFEHTIAVMQTGAALQRIAREAAEDLADQGVVYAELRFAPLLHTRAGLDPVDVVEAVIDGLEVGARSTGLSWGIIVDAIRSTPASEEAAELAVRFAGRGVVGFDLAGPERGYPPDHHLPAIRLIREYGLSLTLHAGEAGGVASLAAAVLRCGADRVGHGIEVIEDCVVADGRIAELGTVATIVRDRRVPLEVCVSSNLATKRWTEAEHPLGVLHAAGFNVTLNTDNRLMSATSMPAEQRLAMDCQGLTITDLARMTRSALEAAFCSEPLRRRLWNEEIAPAYLAAGGVINRRW